MEQGHRFVMLDPATDQLLAECAGPDASGRCPQAETPPYTCAGLRIVGLDEGSELPALTVTAMEPGRCPLAVITRSQAAQEF